jgi:hypothetical protein
MSPRYPRSRAERERLVIERAPRPAREPRDDRGRLSRRQRFDERSQQRLRVDAIIGRVRRRAFDDEDELAARRRRIAARAPGELGQAAVRDFLVELRQLARERRPPIGPEDLDQVIEQRVRRRPVS